MWLSTLLALGPVAGLLIAVEQTDQPLLQYGAVGLVALLALVAVRELFKRLGDQYTSELERERARADRLEAQLQHQNELIQERFVTTLQQAAQAIQEAMTVVKDRR